MKVANWESAHLLYPDSSVCFQIPTFQRPYQWSIASAHSLVRDISNTSNDQGLGCWIGVMLVGESQFPCEQERQQKMPGHRCRQVLDGQQRLLTLRLWMLALIDEHVRQTGLEPQSPTSYQRLRLQHTDVHSLNQPEWDSIENSTIITETQFPDGGTRRLARNYLYFRYLILRGPDFVRGQDEIDIPERSGSGTLLDEWTNEESTPLTPTEIVELLECAVSVDITILQHEDGDGDIERIFETLNSKNTALGQYDLFRNFILMKGAQTSAERREIYNNEMSKSEQHILRLEGLDLRQTRDNLDAFFQDFVSVKVGVNASASNSARLFQDWWNSLDSSDAVNFIRQELVPFMYAWATAITAGQKLGASPDTSQIWRVESDEKLPVPEVALRSLWRTENLARRSFVPVTMALLKHWSAEGPTRSIARLIADLKAVESFIARSILAAEPASPFRAIAIQAAAIASKSHVQDRPTLQDWIRDRSPTDKDVRRVVLQSVEQSSGVDLPDEERPATRDLALRVQNSTYCAIIDGIACQLEGEEHVKPLMLKPSQRMTKRKPIQIEHLFPKSYQNWLPDLETWGQDLARMESRLHSLGNTTVLPIKANIRLGNKRLSEKQAELRKDGNPKYNVSSDFYSAKRWTIVDIDRRTRRLCEAALKFWPR